jgi:hypothetical protein
MPAATHPEPDDFSAASSTRGDRADQHAGAEAHDQPDHAQRDAEQERDDRADHK